jgi:tetratricopeptide (TPR) repeat protein
MVAAMTLCPLPWLIGAIGDIAARQISAQQASTRSDIEALQAQALREGEAGQTTEAIRDYQRALALQPEWKEGWWNLGALQYGANQFAEASATLQHVVAFAPELAIAWSLLGLSEFETRNFTDALGHLEKAQTLGIKDDAEIQRVSTYHLALLLIRTAQFERASGLLRANFGQGLIAGQAKTALGLALLHIPLLPEDLDPSREALVLAAGGADTPDQLRALLQTYPEVPYLHYACGLALAKAGRDQEAIALLREESNLSPASPLPWIEISRIELPRNARQASLAAHKAVTLAPTSRAAHEALAAALLATGEHDRAAREQQLAARLDAAPEPPEQRLLLRYANRAAAHPKPDQALWTRAMREYAAADYAAAATDLKQWLPENPGDGTGWSVLGLSEFALKDYDNALLHLDRGQSLGLNGNPQSIQSAQYTLGILLLRAGEFDRAADILAAALKTGPRDAQIEFALGLTLLRKPELPDQVPTQQISLVTTAGRIAVLLRSSQYDAAFPQLRQLLQHYPATPFLHYAYGTALLAVSEFDEASAQMQAEIALSPTSELPLLRLASIALRQHHPADALPWSRHALLLAPNSADAHYLLGRAALEQGDDPTALRELETAARLSPASPEIHFNLARAYARAHMPEQAERERATFAQLNQAAESQRSQHDPQIYTGPR